MKKKTFYTERDIEDLADQGTKSLIIHDDIVLTDLAREKANNLGVALIEDKDMPQIEKQVSQPIISVDLSSQIKAKVVAHVGNRVPEDIIDTVIKRVLAQLNINK